MARGMSVALTAVQPHPREPVADPWARVDALMGQAGFAGAVHRDLTKYPPSQPWKSRPPTRGRRRGGRRTGDLGRGWKMFARPAGRSGGRGEWGTRNRVTYAIYVEGPRPGQIRRRQTDVMRDRGWPSITPVARRRWQQYRGRVVRALNQSDPQVRARARRL